MARSKNYEDVQFDSEDLQAVQSSEDNEENKPSNYFVIPEDTPTVKPVVKELSADEAERRELQRRYKKLRGWKPTTKDLDELQRLVAEAEQAAGIFRT